jgi:hypothetical protein
MSCGCSGSETVAKDLREFAGNLEQLLLILRREVAEGSTYLGVDLSPPLLLVRTAGLGDRYYRAAAVGGVGVALR